MTDTTDTRVSSRRGGEMYEMHPHTEMPYEHARDALDALASNGWKVSPDIAAREGRRPEQMFPVEVAALLDPWTEAIRHDFAALCAVMEEARVAGVADAHDAYHRLEAGVDHETLDLAIEVVWHRGAS